MRMQKGRMNRRKALGWLSGSLTVAAAWMAGFFPEPVRAAFLKRFPIRTVDVEDWRFDPDSGEILWNDGRREEFRLVMDGLVDDPVELSYADLRSLPLISAVTDFHCVEGWSVENVPWSGITFPILFDRVKISPRAGWVVFHSIGKTQTTVEGTDHYVECFPLADLMRSDLGYMLALDLDGSPLVQERGAPARVVCPFDLGYKSIKFVERIEFTNHPREGWWTLANPLYPLHAPVPRRRLNRKDPRLNRAP